MRLLLFHPGALKVTCEQCRQHLYNLETGEQQTYVAGPTREKRPCVRPEGVPTPCDQCPKESPQKARDHELSDKNRRTVLIYLESRATHGASLTPAMRRDPILLRNLAIVDGIYRDYERREVGRESAYSAALLFVGAKR